MRNVMFISLFVVLGSYKTIVIFYTILKVPVSFSTIITAAGQSQLKYKTKKKYDGEIIRRERKIRGKNF